MSSDHAGRVSLPAVLPALPIVVVIVADQLVGNSVVLGLVAVAPLLAASLYGPLVTGRYGAVALAVGALLGVLDHAYTPGEALAAQSVRLGMIAAMSVTGVILARHRVQREARLSRVTKVAEAAQRAILLPVPQRLGPARVAVHYESAATDALIGGDMYGMVLTGHGLRVLVGDVRGKGLDAVRMSAQVLATFRERASDHPDLSVLLDHMDRTVALYPDGDEDFVTAVLAQIDDTGRLTIAMAGHPPPFLLTQGRVRQMPGQSSRPPLGLGGQAETQAFVLSPGDRLLLYTDGLTEARHPDTREFLPARAIIAALAADHSPADAIEALRLDVLAWSGGTLDDDLALVLIEYHPETPSTAGPAQLA